MNIFNLIIPPACYSCRRRIPTQSECLCPECKAQLVRHKENVMDEFVKVKVAFEKAVALFVYDDIMRKLIHIFKYKGVKKLGIFFVNYAINILKTEYPEFLQVDATVCVPMTSTRMREREFNQSAFLTEQIAKGLQIENYSKCITKKGIALQHARMSRLERLSRADSYSLRGQNPFKGKKILLIDDVITTGATANGLSKFLKDCKAKKVYVMTIARPILEEEKNEDNFMEDFLNEFYDVFGF